METKIINPKVKYPNGFKVKQDDGTLKTLYDEDYCILTKTIGNNTIRVIEKYFSYALVINETTDTIEDSDLGRVIHDIIQYKDTDKLVNKMNTYSKRWITEPIPYKKGDVRTIDATGYNTIIYSNSEEFVKDIKKDISLFHYEYPDHELETITIYNHNRNYYRIVLLLDDCDVEQHMEYIIHKDNIEETIPTMKKMLRKTIRNETGKMLIKEI